MHDIIIYLEVSLVCRCYRAFYPRLRNGSRSVKSELSSRLDPVKPIFLRITPPMRFSALRFSYPVLISRFDKKVITTAMG